MNISPLTNKVTVAVATLVAAAAFAVGAVIQLTHEQSGETTIHGAIEHIEIGALSLVLIALIPVVLMLGELAGTPRRAYVAVTGMVALALVATASNINGDDFAIFPFVAAPANLLWLGGFIALAVGLRKNTTLSLGLVVGLPLTWFAALMLSPFGGGLLAAAYFVALGHRLGLWTKTGRAYTARAAIARTVTGAVILGALLIAAPAAVAEKPECHPPADCGGGDPTPPNTAPTVSVNGVTVAFRNQQVTAIATGHDDDGDSLTYSWDLDGNGLYNDGTGSQAKMTWNTLGIGTMSVRVSDGKATGTATHRVSIVNNTPVAGMTIITPEAAWITGKAIEFDGAPSVDYDGTIVGYEWDLDGDGQFDDGNTARATFIYTTPGEKLIRLRVTDNDGAKHTYPMIFPVAEPPVVDPGSGGGEVPAGNTPPANGPVAAAGQIPAQARIAAKATIKAGVSKKKTKVKQLTLSALPTGASVVVSYKGTAKTVIATGSTLALAQQFKGKRLGAGTVITVTVSKGGMQSQTLKITTQKKGQPKLG